MRGNKFKRYAYFSRLEYTDILKLTKWEYTSNRIIDDVIDTLSLPEISRITVGDIVALVFLPLRVVLMGIFCPLQVMKQRRIAAELSLEERESRHISGICLYTVDWKNKFERSRPSSWNNY